MNTFIQQIFDNRIKCNVNVSVEENVDQKQKKSFNNTKSKKRNRKRTDKSCSQGNTNDQKDSFHVVESVPTQPPLQSTLKLQSGVALIRTRNSNSSMSGPKKTQENSRNLTRKQYNEYIGSIKNVVQQQQKAASNPNIKPKSNVDFSKLSQPTKAQTQIDSKVCKPIKILYCHYAQN